MKFLFHPHVHLQTKIYKLNSITNDNLYLISELNKEATNLNKKNINKNNSLILAYLLNLLFLSFFIYLNIELSMIFSIVIYTLFLIFFLYKIIKFYLFIIIGINDYFN